MNNTISLGWTKKRGKREQLRLASDLLIKRHANVTGRSGCGKTQSEIGLFLHLAIHYPNLRLIWFDCKGHGADDLLNMWLPVLSEQYPHLSSENISVIAPNGPFTFEMNMLAPIPGLPPDVQANVCVSLFEHILGENIGPRMVPILQRTIEAVMETRGSLVHVLKVLEDDTYREAVVGQLKDLELRHYMASVLPEEPQASIGAIRARLTRLLSLKKLRRMLNSESCLTNEKIIGSPINIIHLGDPPLGFDELSVWLGSWYLHLITAAIFSRKDYSNQIVCFIDEFDVLAKSSGLDFERILQKARSFGATLRLATQSLAQLDNRTLVETILTNCSMWTAFSPRPDELKYLSHLLPMPTGAMIDPYRPDQRLSEKQEEKLMLQRLKRLRVRQAFFADMARGQSHLISQTMSLPINRVAQQAEQIAPDIIQAFWRGKYGQQLDELPQAQGVVMEEPESASALSSGPSPSHSKRRSPRLRQGSGGRGRKLKLELPE